MPSRADCWASASWVRQGVVFIEVAVNGVEPVDRGAQHLLHGSGHDARHVLHKADPASGGSAKQDQKDGGRNNDTHAHPIFFQIFFQRMFTPCSFSIFPSLHRGRPITLKKSPSMCSTKSAPLPWAP